MHKKVKSQLAILATLFSRNSVSRPMASPMQFP